MSGLKLRDYQEDAADFIYEHDRSLILAKVGAGKTAIVLTAIQDMQRDKVTNRWLVVAPERVSREVWPQEKELWAPGLTMSLAVGGAENRTSAVAQKTDIVVVNYDVLQQFAEQYPDLSLYFDGVVFDELTRVKTPGNPRSRSTTVQNKGKRYEAINRAIAGIDLRVGLTGSFTSDGLEDCFGQVRMIDETRLGTSRGAFLQKYFWSANPKIGEWVPRPKALQQIMERIKPIAYILESKEYADTLPPIHIIPVDCEIKDRRMYDRMKRNFALEIDGATITAVNAGVLTGKLRQLASGFVYETHTTPDPSTPGKFITTQTPHWYSRHKFDALDDLLAENHNEPTIVFYAYKEELAELHRRYPHAQTLDDRDAVKRWNAGKISLLLAHPDSAQYGLNLQHGGCAIVYTTLPWSLVNFEQANGRLHRSGQRHEVRVYWLRTKNTVDERAMEVLEGKATLADIAREALQ